MTMSHPERYSITPTQWAAWVIRYLGLTPLLLVWALLIGPDSMTGISLLGFLVIVTVRGKIVPPLAIAVAILLALGACAVIDALYNNGLVVQQTALSNQFTGSNGVSPSFSLLHLSPGQLLDAAGGLAFEGLCCLWLIRVIEWGQEQGVGHSAAKPSSLPWKQISGCAAGVAGALGSFLATHLAGLSVAEFLGVLVGVFNLVDASWLMTIAATMLACSSIALVIDNSGVLTQWNWLVTIMADHGIITVQPICNTLGLLASFLMLASLLAHSRPLHAAREG